MVSQTRCSGGDQCFPPYIANSISGNRELLGNEALLMTSRGPAEP
jgi:hypothetical protein